MSHIERGYSLEEHIEGQSRNLDAPFRHLELARELADLRRPSAEVLPPIAEEAQAPSQRAWQLSGHSAKTLAKYPDLRVLLITLKCGETLGEHRATGPVSLQILEGRVRVKVSREAVDLVVGSLLTLGPSVVHDLEALDESAVLLTIAGATASEERGESDLYC